MELSAGNGIVGVRLSEFVMTRFASKASTSGRGLLTFIQSFELSFSVRALLRLSPPPWTVEELEACFVVTDNAVRSPMSISRMSRVTLGGQAAQQR